MHVYLLKFRFHFSEFILFDSSRSKESKIYRLQVSIEKVKSYGYSTSHLEKGKLYQ